MLSANGGRGNPFLLSKGASDMKKKGFTLIELLAVIVVLSVIALITVPMVMNVIEKTRKEAFKDSVLGAFTTLDYYLLKNDLQDIPEEGIEVKNLELKNNPFKYGIIIKNSEGKLEAVDVSDGKYCAQGEQAKLEVYKGECDLTVPTCKLEIKGEKGINEWYGSKVTVEMETSEALTGGLQFGIGTEEKYDKSVEKGKKGKAEIEVEAKGKISCYVKNAGNKKGNNEIEVKIDTTEPTEANFSTTTTSNSIKVIASGKDEESGIVRYQFSKDGGKTWTKIQESEIYTFEGLKQQEYEIKVRVYNGTYVESKGEDNQNKESDIQKVSPSVITNPTIAQESQTPSNGEYAQERVMKITYHHENIINPEYYLKSSVTSTVEQGIMIGSCGAGNTPEECNTETTTTLQANTWYKTNKETVSVTYQTNGELYAVTSDGLNISGTATASITNIDRENPTVSVSVSGKTATITFTDNLALAGYQVTTEETESSNWETISGTSSTKTYTAEKAGTHYVYVKDGAGNTNYSQFSVAEKEFEQEVLSNVGVNQNGTFDASVYTKATISGSASINWSKDCHSATSGNACATAKVNFTCGSTVYSYQVASLCFSNSSWNKVTSSSGGNFNTTIDLAEHGITCSNATVSLTYSNAGVYCSTGWCNGNTSSWCTGSCSLGSAKLTVVVKE